ncbi:cyclin-dependent kinase-like 5 [Sphaeramia orbicularis]|uniref:cyclin-dependent kinase-like 5 n=1 Tax=Sphaeramia orbicularis TaxID=375764 RepID=UPI001180567D|nr:cyclin-dependent kinase-like 5 [Sphaeramia orbicularis]
MERYQSLGLVGEGSYGTVLKCRHRGSGRLVAIKKFLDSDDDRTVKKIAQREIKLLRQLRHDNLVNLLEVWKRRRRWYLVFEFVERTLLDELEQNPNGLDLNTSRQYLFQILRAGAFCHQQNIIHRDIKPENILISHSGVIKLCDFGFARTVASPAEGGVYTDYVATRWYRPPELLVGDTKYGKPVDVWAVGCLFMEMLTSQPLFPGDSDLDQIHHIVRCFGHLTSHHQELFYTNPVFTGVRLPQCFSVIPLQQRFPTLPPTALDLAQRCLQMDPDERAQCSELLEHLLFTQDSFHIRFSDELNAKIQKDHRENSTLPKILKTARHVRDDGEEKERRGKDKKQAEDVDDKVLKEKGKPDKEAGEDKSTKTKNKQSSKLSKALRNTSEPLMTTKPSKTAGAKGIDNGTPMVMKSKPGKAGDAGWKTERTMSDSTKTSNNTTTLKDNHTSTAKCKNGKVASPEQRQAQSQCLEDAKGSSCSLSQTVAALKPQRSPKSEPSPKFVKSFDTNTVKLSERSTTPNPDGGSTPVTSLDLLVPHTGMNTKLKIGPMSTTASTTVMSKMSNSTPTPQVSKESSSDNTPSVDHITKAFETASVSKHQTHELTMDKDRSVSETVKGLQSKLSEASSNFGPKTVKTTTSSSSSLQKSSLSVYQVTSNPKFSKNSSTSDSKSLNDPMLTLDKPSKGPPADRGHNTTSTASKNQQESSDTSNKDVKDGSTDSLPPKTGTDNNHRSDASGRGGNEQPHSCEDYSVHQQNHYKSKLSTESQTPDTNPTPNSEPSHFPKAPKVFDKENTEDLALFLSTTASTKYVGNQTSKVSVNLNNEQKSHNSQPDPEVKVFHTKPLTVEPKTKVSSFGNQSRSTAATTSRTLKPFPTDPERKGDHLEQKDARNPSTESDSGSGTSTVTPEQRDLTRTAVLHHMDPTEPDECNPNPCSSTPPPPPPPPSSTPLLLLPPSTPLGASFSVAPPSTPLGPSFSVAPPSTPLGPSFSVAGTNRLAAGSEHLSLGTSFPSNSLR